MRIHGSRSSSATTPSWQPKPTFLPHTRRFADGHPAHLVLATRPFAAERLRGIEASGYATGTDATPAGAQRERRPR
jgi:hypothetical protein